MIKTVLVTLLLFVSIFCFSQERFWKFENEQAARRLNTQRPIIPQRYKLVSLDIDSYKTFLKTSPLEVLNKINGLEISLPYPDGSFKKFRIAETKVMEDGLAAKFPGIKTYVGKGIDEPSATIRIDYTYQGFHAYVRSRENSFFIDPYEKENQSLYISYFSKDYINKEKEIFNCGTSETLLRNINANRPFEGTCIGTQLKTYRTAISCTGEYAIAVCPPGNVTVANTLSAIVTTINRVTGIYETELDIKLLLIDNENAIIYTDPATDPYSGNNDGGVLIGESQTNITNVIGSNNFDVGHTFSTGGGGLATLAVACDNSQKARGVTGTTNPTGDSYDVDYVAHEMGHQFGAVHPFESENNFCGGGNRFQNSAYEVGSGSTIMSYSGLCGSDNIQPHSDPYFHTKNFDEIVQYVTNGFGNTCGITSGTDNKPPVVIMPVNNLKIPKHTPFTLTGSGTDPDGDELTYCWEEWDLSNSASGSAWNSGATSTTRPLFRSRLPKTTGSRTFPEIEVILAGYPSNPPAEMNGLKGETLPEVARDINFRLTVRDNKPLGGGVATGGDGCSSVDTFKVVVTDDGPFTLTSPNTFLVWLGASTQNVTWDVANTNDPAGINCQKVDILMSIDGGYTYPITVLAGTANDGSENIIVPNIPITSNTVRFMVKAADNVFFDISDNDFTVTYNPLPVTILNFTAKPDQKNILLTWSTATEINNKGFEIQRSEGDDNDFEKIGFVDGAINSNSTKNYSFTDDNVKENIEYFYRLRQIDLDSNSFFSNIETAKVAGTGRFISLHPQPFYKNTQLVINGLQKKNFSLIISDAQGKIILKKEINNTEENISYPLDFSSNAAGVYIIKVLQEGTFKTIKALKLKN